jgi:hypothetical protein
MTRPILIDTLFAKTYSFLLKGFIYELSKLYQVY